MVNIQVHSVLLIELYDGFSSFPYLPSPHIVVTRRKDKGKPEPYAVYYEETVEIQTTYFYADCDTDLIICNGCEPFEILQL